MSDETRDETPDQDGLSEEELFDREEELEPDEHVVADRANTSSGPKAQCFARTT